MKKQKKEENIYKRLYESQERASKEATEEWEEEQQKAKRFKQAISKIVVIAREKGLGGLYLSDSFNMAQGNVDGEFISSWLVVCFRDTINAYEEDANDKGLAEVNILSQASEFNSMAIQSLL